MSVFVFYAEASVGCACILMLLLYSIKKLPTPQFKFNLFYQLVVWHIVYFISDTAWALVNNGTIPKTTFSVLTVNYLNAVIVAIVFYCCFAYAEISTRPEMTRLQIQSLRTKLRIPIYVESVLLLTSFILMPEFWLDQNLEPRDLYYFFLLFLPFVYIMTVTIRCFGRVLKPHSQLNMKTYLIVASYTPGCIVAGAVQLFLSLTTPVFCFWCTMIILFVYLNSQNQLISTDPLTALNNRNQLQRYLQLSHDSIDHYVVMVDIDKFKQINDTYGHVEGDRALVLVSKALKSACGRLGKSTFLCRYGGDEFLIVVPTELPGLAIRVIKDCLKEELSSHYAKPSYALDVSIGYAFWNGKLSSFKQSVAEADEKMYEDKRS